MSNNFDLNPSVIDVEPIDILDTDHDGRVRILVHWEHSPIDSHLSETLNYFLAVKEFEGDQNLFIPTLHVVNRVSIIIIMATIYLCIVQNLVMYMYCMVVHIHTLAWPLYLQESEQNILSPIQ